MPCPTALARDLITRALDLLHPDHDEQELAVMLLRDTLAVLGQHPPAAYVR